MAGLERPDEAVEEAAAAGGGFAEEAVHLRGEPDGGGDGGDVGLAADGRAVEAEDAALRWAVGRGAGGDVGFGVVTVDAADDAPGCAVAAEFGDAGLAEAAAGNEEGDGFEEVGLAGAVRSGDGGEPGGWAPGEGGVAAEIGEGEAGEAHERFAGARPPRPSPRRGRERRRSG